jgi:hypothetical protein
MIILNPEELDRYRSELVGFPEAIAALKIVQEWDGDLADAAESIATLNGIEGVEDNAENRWFFIVLLKIRDWTGVCEPANDDFRENYFSAMIPTIAEIMSANFGCSPGIATLIATPFAIYIQKEGMDKFCAMSLF